MGTMLLLFGCMLIDLISMARLVHRPTIWGCMTLILFGRLLIDLQLASSCRLMYRPVVHPSWGTKDANLVWGMQIELIGIVMQIIYIRGNAASPLLTNQRV